MNQTQKAAMLRIIGKATLELAHALDGVEIEATQSDAEATPVLPALPAYEAKRVNYLQAFVDAGGTLTLAQVRMAAKKAGMGNPGSVTSKGYVEKTGPDSRTITAKGKAWLAKRTGKAA
jgi:hypothetical protein